MNGISIRNTAFPRPERRLMKRMEQDLAVALMACGLELAFGSHADVGRIEAQLDVVLVADDRTAVEGHPDGVGALHALAQDAVLECEMA